jgi:hypothetical protein
MSLVKNGSICVRLNDRNEPFFKPGKGLKQGGPIPPLLFNLVVDVFTRMLSKAVNKCYISGFMGDVIPGGWSVCNMQMTHSCSSLMTLDMLAT